MADALLRLENLARLARLAKALEKAGGPDDSEAPIILGGLIRPGTYSMIVEDIEITAGEAAELIKGAARELAALGVELDSILADLRSASQPYTKPGGSKRIATTAHHHARRIKDQIRAAFAAGE
jgi:hypothetical protein